MVQVAVEGDRLLTRYAASPRVTMKADTDGTEAMVEFDSSLIEPDGMSWVTILRFKGVTDFRFADEPGGAQERLAEVEDSPVGLLQRELHHYRIAFSDHGVYDIVGTGIDVFTERAVHG